MKNGDNLWHFFFFIGTFLYKCIQSLRMRNWGIDRAWHRDPNALWETKVRGQVMTHSCPPQFSLSARTGQCVCLCCFSPQFAHNDLQNQAAATLKDKEEKIVCLCVCVSLSRWAPQSMTWHILHGAFSKLVAEVRVRSPKWWPSRKLQLSFSHLFLSLPVTRSL